MLLTRGMGKAGSPVETGKTTRRIEGGEGDKQGTGNHEGIGVMAGQII